MKAKVMGYNEFEDSCFSYELLNIVSVLQVMDKITIQYIDETGMLQKETYSKDKVKIVIEN